MLGHKGRHEPFELMCAFAQRGLRKQGDRTAGIAVLVYLFEICDVFGEMILPTKHILQNEALLGVGATVLANLTGPKTVSSLWEDLRSEPNVGTFERFVLASNLVYLIGAIDMKDGLLFRAALQHDPNGPRQSRVPRRRLHARPELSAGRPPGLRPATGTPPMRSANRP